MLFRRLPNVLQADIFPAAGLPTPLISLSGGFISFPIPIHCRFTEN